MYRFLRLFLVFSFAGLWAFSGFAVTQDLTVNVNQRAPTAVIFAPTSLALSNQSVAGAVVATISVTMTNNYTFTGNLTFGAPNGDASGAVVIVGNQVKLARDLTPSDSVLLFTVIATQGLNPPVANNFTLTVTSAPPPPTPEPTGVVFSPPSASASDGSLSGALITTVSVTMSNNGTFTGSLAFGPPNNNGSGAFVLVGSQVKLARNLTPSDDGTLAFTVVATQGSSLPVSATFTLTVTSAPVPTPTAVVFNPSNSVTIPDTSTLGTLITTVSVTTSNNSAFTGTLGFGPPNNNASGAVSLTGNQVKLARNLTPSDDGSLAFTVVATQGATSVSNTFVITVISTAPPPPPVPIITINPVSPSIPSNSSVGTTAFTAVITMSDGSAFVGTVAFTTPFFNDAGLFALSGRTVIVNGTLPNTGSTEQVSIIATQP